MREATVSIELFEKLLGFVRLGLIANRAAVAVGVTAEQLRRLQDDEESAEALRRADAVAEALALKRIATGEGGSDARWLLERRWPDRYAPARTVAAPKGAKPAEDQGTAQAPDNDALRRAELRRQGRPALTAVKA